MAAVSVWGSLRAATGGVASVEIEAKNIRELLARLAETYPGLAPQIERGVSVSIDGTIYNDDWTRVIRADSEVVLLPRIAGG